MCRGEGQIDDSHERIVGIQYNSHTDGVKQSELEQV
jgi:hypothetical protein